MEGVCTVCGITADLDDEGKCPNCAGGEMPAEEMSEEMPAEEMPVEDEPEM